MKLVYKCVGKILSVSEEGVRYIPAMQAMYGTQAECEEFIKRNNLSPKDYFYDESIW